MCSLFKTRHNTSYIFPGLLQFLNMEHDKCACIERFAGFKALKQSDFRELWRERHACHCQNSSGLCTG